MIGKQIKKDLIKVLKKLKISPKKLSLEHPLRTAQGKLDHGDYSTNVAMIKFQKGKTGFLTPVDLANKIVNTWRSLGLPEYLAKIEVAPPGFINLKLSPEFLSTELVEVLKKGNRYGSSKIGKGKTVVIDYSSPNIAKPFGIGHLRSTIIGQALYNIYKFSDWRTIGDNHLGDWGTQFGKLTAAIKHWSKKPASKLTVGELEKLYVKFHKEAEKNPKLKDEARAWFKKLEEDDNEAKEIWKTCIKISLKEFGRIYQLLGVKIDYALGESFYEDKMGEVINEAKRKRIAGRSEGAWIIKFPKLNIPPAMILKSDGATTYEMRDLACIKYRKKRWHPDLYIYEVGADQALHFQQTFAAAEMLGYGKLNQFVHIPHGLIRWKHGKFSTRRGQTIHLEDILNEAIKRARKVIESSETNRGLKVKEQEKIAEAVGIGAVKYFDLSHHPITDIIFDWEKTFQLEGNSGPYLQYTYARCQSVLRRAGISIFQFPISNLRLTNEEISVLRTIYKFPEVVAEAGENYSPNLICNFLFDLAQKYNFFYNKLPILKAESEELKDFRLALTAAVGQIIKNGLYLLGIETPERM